MAYGNIKKLASMTLHATESIVYAASASKVTEIATLWIHNRATGSASVTAWFPFTASQATGSFAGSNSLQRFNETLSGSVTLEISPKVPFILDGAANEKLTMKTNITGSVNVIIFGREEI